MIKDRQSSTYYLQVVKEDEEPGWPVPENELIVGSRELGGGYYQFWAYPEDSGKEADDLPPAERVAGEYHQPKPMILIDQKDDLLELILVKDAHAWAHSSSSLENLEDNISEMLDFAKQKFEFEAEHFMTTDRVSKEAEGKLNGLEKTGDAEEEVEEEVEEEKEGVSEEPTPGPGPAEAQAVEEENPWSIRQVKSQPPSFLPHAGRSVVHPTPQRGGNSSRAGRSKIAIVLLPIILVGVFFAGVVAGKEQILERFRGQAIPAPEAKVTSLPAPTATPTPAPSVDRTSLKVRVLNGTTKTGAAATLASKLKDLGWQVPEMGNAAKKGVEQTVVRVKAEGGELGEVLASDLASDYEASISADLKETDKVDAEVVIGLK